MNAIALSGQDSVTIDDRVLSDFADGDYGVLDYDADLAVVKKGKNGNTIYSFNAAGDVATFKLRLVRGSSDDKYMLNKLNSQRSNFAGFALMQGELVKKIGDGAGNITNDTYVLGGGIFRKNVAGKTNAEGDTNQSVAEYTITFGNAPRGIG